MHKFQNDIYGSNFFPTFQTVQNSVFVGSFTGSQIKKHGGQFLIKPTPPGGGQIQRAKRDLPGV